MHRLFSTTAIAALAGMLLASPAMAQTGRTLVIAGPSAVLQAPRGDARVIGTATKGTVVRVRDRFQDWYLVDVVTPSGRPVNWTRGWIHADALQLPNGRNAPHKQGRLMVRGFGHAGGLMFTARDSFEVILGNSFNSVYGGGAQVVLPNGVFAQASIDRSRKTGTRAFVSGSQIFTVEVPNRVTVTPLVATVGFRKESSNRIATYFGGGAGWHTLAEDSPTIADAQDFSKRYIGYHVLGGVEYPIVRWVWLAGEAQWATVPKALGDSGVSAVFGEKDLGGTTFRVKVIVGY